MGKSVGHASAACGKSCSARVSIGIRSGRARARFVLTLLPELAVCKDYGFLPRLHMFPCSQVLLPSRKSRKKKFSVLLHDNPLIDCQSKEVLDLFRLFFFCYSLDITPTLFLETWHLSRPTNAFVPGVFSF